MKLELLTKNKFESAIFLTHTVQMKLTLFFVLFYLTPAIAFLTHTVQMKQWEHYP